MGSEREPLAGKCIWDRDCFDSSVASVAAIKTVRAPDRGRGVRLATMLQVQANGSRIVPSSYFVSAIALA